MLVNAGFSILSAKICVNLRPISGCRGKFSLDLKFCQSSSLLADDHKPAALAPIGRFIAFVVSLSARQHHVNRPR
jgi:hypothetical protein